MAAWYATATIPVFSPYAWKSGMARKRTSSGPAGAGSIAASCSWLASSARWVSIAPFGAPDVPDV